LSDAGFDLRLLNYLAGAGVAMGLEQVLLQPPDFLIRGILFRLHAMFPDTGSSSSGTSPYRKEWEESPLLLKTGYGSTLQGSPV
jgi:hypothetical protein